MVARQCRAEAGTMNDRNKIVQLDNVQHSYDNYICDVRLPVSTTTNCQ